MTRQSRGERRGDKEHHDRDDRFNNERQFVAPPERLFHGHGIASDEPWLVNVIEPNLAGATAIAEHWYELLRVEIERPAEEARLDPSL